MQGFALIERIREFTETTPVQVEVEVEVEVEAEVD